MFLLFALVETIGGVVGGILEAQRGTRFVFSESLEDACFAFSALGLVAVVLRCSGKLSAAGGCSVVSVVYGLGKSIVVAVSSGPTPDAPSLGCAACACAGAIGAFLAVAKEQRVARQKVLGGASELTGGDYSKLEDASGDGSSAEKKVDKLTFGAILRLLKPYFWPRNWAGRFAVVSTLVFVSLSKVCSIVAPLLLATAANAVADGDPPRTGPRRGGFHLSQLESGS